MQVPKALLESRDNFIRNVWRKIPLGSEIRVEDAITATEVYLSVMYMYPSDYSDPGSDKQVHDVLEALRDIQSQLDAEERERDNS